LKNKLFHKTGIILFFTFGEHFVCHKTV